MTVARVIPKTQRLYDVARGTYPPAASDTAAGLIEIATQAEQEAGTALDRAVVSGRQHFHPSAAKAWCALNTSGGLGQSYNITSVTDNGTGSWSVNIATDFSGQFWAGFAFGGHAATALIYNCTTTTAGVFNILAFNTSSAATDPTSDNIFFVGFGDQA